MTMRDSIAAARISGPQRMAEGTAVFEFRFGADDPMFAGHFPAHPLVPGIFQLEMTRAAAEWVLSCRLGVREVSKAKFQRPIYPAELVRMELKWSEAGDRSRRREEADWPRVAATPPPHVGGYLVRAGFSVGGQQAGETRMRLWRSE